MLPSKIYRLWPAKATPTTAPATRRLGLVIELSLVEIRSDPCVRLSERMPEDLYLGAYRPPLEHLVPRHQHASAPVRDLDHEEIH